MTRSPVLRRRILPALAALLAASAVPARAQAPERLAGEVATADGGSAAGLVVRVRAAAFADSVVLDSAGRFSLSVPARADSAELVVDAAGGAERRYHPALARLARADVAAEQRFVMVPREWRIAEGAHAGTTVEISVHRAFGGPCAGCSGFYARDPALTAPAWPPRFRAWPQRAFPLRVAFDRGYSGASIQPADSAAFWEVAAAVEEAFGSDLFRPVRYYETMPLDNRYDYSVLVLADPGLGDNAGLTTLISERGEIVHASMRLRRRPSAFAGPHVMAHELVHTLGFGHTCAWRSVVADVRRCEMLSAPSATPEDVAYGQLYLRVRSLQRSRGARWGMEAALAGEQQLVLGLPREAPPRTLADSGRGLVRETWPAEDTVPPGAPPGP